MNPFFQYVNNFWEKTTSFNSKTAQANHRSIIRIASFQEDSFQFADTINRLPRVPEWAKAAYLHYSLPHRNARPKKLPKSKIRKVAVKKQKQLDKIASRFNCSEYHAEQILRILKSQKIEIGE